MTKSEIVEKYREGLISAVNKMLDTLYDEDEKNTSAPVYEDLRRALIDKVELTPMQYNLVAIVSSYNSAKFAQMVQTCAKAVEIFDEITKTIQADLEPKS